MATKEDKDSTRQGQEGRDRARRWIRRAQAIVGIRTPGTRRRQGMCEAAERKARREMPYVEYPDADEPAEEEKTDGTKAAPAGDS